MSANVLAPSAITPGGEDSEWTFAQFTGLQDVNGKEIYEGDVLSYVSVYDQYREMEVRWDEDEVRFLMPPNGAKEITIVGNVCENPDLLSL